MTQRVYIDRSRYETAQRCLRARFYEYHQDGMGIVSARKPLPLAVGSSVHRGLEFLLRASMGGAISEAIGAEKIEDGAVAAALSDFATYESAIDVDTGEIASRASLPADAPALSEMDAYLYREQQALVEAMTRAYSRRRLRPLLEQFEVLEVEREGEWLLGTGYPVNDNSGDGDYEMWFMSRPDALLRERESNQLYLLSFKTAASWDIRKARDAEHDMQGMSEGIEIERRLADWWNMLHHPMLVSKADGTVTEAPIDPVEGRSQAMVNYLAALDAPPRILAVRMEYMLKGERWRDKELSQQFGVEMRSQKSHLIRAYEAVSVPMRGAAGYNIGDKCWSWEYVAEDGRERSLAWQQWKSKPVFEEKK